MRHTLDIASVSPVDLPNPGSRYTVAQDSEGDIGGVVIAVRPTGPTSGLVEIEMAPEEHWRYLRILNRE